MKRKFTFFLLLSVMFLFISGCFAEVIKKDGKVFIRDRRGENWDITQAVSIGFDPDGFEFGLGRNAFTPLDDNNLQDSYKSTFGKLRVLGVPGEKETRAYSVNKLSRHEVANSYIDDQPIAAAY